MILGHTIVWFFPLQSIYPVKTKKYSANLVKTADKNYFLVTLEWRFRFFINKKGETGINKEWVHMYKEDLVAGGWWIREGVYITFKEGGK